MLHLHPANYTNFSDQPEIPQRHGLLQSLDSKRPLQTSVKLKFVHSVRIGIAFLQDCVIFYIATEV